MAILVTLKRRIRVAKNIAKTTRAMKMVAASKTRRAQESALKGRPYAEKLAMVTKNLIGRIPDDYSHPFLIEREGKSLIVIFSPDKGLCGSLVSNLKKELLSSPNFKNAVFVTIGKKLSRTVAGMGLEILADFPMGTAQPTFEKIPPLAQVLIDGFLKNEFSQVFVLYPRFVSLFSQRATVEKLLPLEIPKEPKEEMLILPRPYYLFEPRASDVLESLLPHYLESLLYQLLLEAYASEQAARMLAMQNATQNALEIINFLTLEYNKARQERITNEILDVTRATHAILGV